MHGSRNQVTMEGDKFLNNDKALLFQSLLQNKTKFISETHTHTHRH